MGGFMRKAHGVFITQICCVWTWLLIWKGVAFWMSLTSTCSTTWWLSLLFSRSKSVLERSKHLHRRPLRSWVGPSFSAAKVRRLVEGKMTVRQGLSAAINIGDSPYFVI